jgi:hypothetical protein
MSHYPSLLGVQASPEQSRTPHGNAHGRLFTEQSCMPLGMLARDSIYTGDCFWNSTLKSSRRRRPKWLPRRTNTSMPTRKRSLLRKNPPSEPTSMKVTPPTQRKTTTTTTTGAMTTTTMPVATTTTTRALSISPLLRVCL